MGSQADGAVAEGIGFGVALIVMIIAFASVVAAVLPIVMAWATPGGPVVGFSIGAVALKVGGGPPQVIAYVIAWALFAFQRLILWEIPFMPARFVWFRAAVSLPFPFLAAAIAMAIGKP